MRLTRGRAASPLLADSEQAPITRWFSGEKSARLDQTKPICATDARFVVLHIRARECQVIAPGKWSTLRRPYISHGPAETYMNLHPSLALFCLLPPSAMEQSSLVIPFSDLQAAGARDGENQEPKETKPSLDLPSSSPHQSPPPPAQTTAAPGSQQSSQFSIRPSQDNCINPMDGGSEAHHPGGLSLLRLSRVWCIYADFCRSDGMGQLQSRDSHYALGPLQNISEIVDAPSLRFNAQAEIGVPVQQALEAYEKFQKGGFACLHYALLTDIEPL